MRPNSVSASLVGPLQAAAPGKRLAERILGAATDGASWLSQWEEELLAFPNAAHDDQVDTVAYAARELGLLQTITHRQKQRGKTLTGGLMAREL